MSSSQLPSYQQVIHNTPEPLEISVIKMQKDLEFLVAQTIEQKVRITSLETKIGEFEAFLARWRGAALALIVLGASLTWLFDKISVAMTVWGNSTHN